MVNDTRHPADIEAARQHALRQRAEAERQGPTTPGRFDPDTAGVPTTFPA